MEAGARYEGAVLVSELAKRVKPEPRHDQTVGR